MTEPVPRNKIPENGMDPKTAYHLIHDELATQGNPTMNLSSFVTTVMDEECDRLISENIGVNYIDTEVYRANLEIQNRCVAMLNDLYHAPDPDKCWGIETIGSSEALMLSILTHKRVWQEKREAEGKPTDKPNIVMGNDVHLAWNKGSIYFDVEQRLIPLKPDRYTITPEEVLERVDENTIMVVGVPGTSYTFEYDPNDALVKLKNERGLDIPLHVDGASGAFIAPFLNPEIKWDFQLEQVRSINVSGHKIRPGLSGHRLGLVARRSGCSGEPRHRDERSRLPGKIVQSELLPRWCDDSRSVLQPDPSGTFWLHRNPECDARKRSVSRERCRGDGPVRHDQRRCLHTMLLLQNEG